jgi:hypothetical protein
LQNRVRLGQQKCRGQEQKQPGVAGTLHRILVATEYRVEKARLGYRLGRVFRGALRTGRIVLLCRLAVNDRLDGSFKQCLLGPPNHSGDREWTIPAKLERTRQCLRCGRMVACTNVSGKPFGQTRRARSRVKVASHGFCAEQRCHSFEGVSILPPSKIPHPQSLSATAL